MRPILLPLLALALACSSGEDGPAVDPPAALLKPTDAMLAEHAPDTARYRVETGRGAFVIETYRAWAPRGADRFHQLATHGFFDGVRFFRVVESFMAQFGLNGDPRVASAWEDLTVPDDSVRASNVRGAVSFAMHGAGTRSTQLFINLVDNRNLDEMGFAPIGRVVEGMSVVDSLYGGYGDAYPHGAGPDQGRIAREGNRYLRRQYPKLDSIVRVTVVGR